MSERMRLAMLCDRDGEDAAKEWARSTAKLYQQAIDTPAHFASHQEWRPRFERVIRELTVFLQTGIP